MAEQRRPYTDEELIDFGWNEIKDKLPKKKRRRVVWLWLPAAGLFLGMLYFGWQKTMNDRSPVVKETRNNKEQIHPSTDKQNKSAEQNSTTRGQESIVEKKEQWNSSEVIESSSKKNKNAKSASVRKKEKKSNGLFAKLTTQDYKQDIHRESNQDGFSQNEYSANESDFAPKEFIKTELSAEKNKTIKQTQKKETLNEVKPVNKTFTKKEKDSAQEKETTDNKQIAQAIKNEITENTTEQEQALEKAKEAVELKKEKKTKRFLPFAQAQALTNEFDYFGGQIGGGITYQLSEKQQLSAGVEFGLMQEHLHKFTTFQTDIDANADTNNFTSPSGKNVEYEVLLIEVPLTYSHQVSKKLSLSGGIVANYADFKDFYQSSSSNEEAERFLVSSSDTQIVMTNNLSNPNNRVATNLYRISDSFVEQFNQVSLGANTGFSYKLNDVFTIDASTSFAFQPLSEKEFMDYAPNFVQIGAKYYFYKKK